MALCKLASGQGIELTAEKGLAIWQVLQGQVEPTPEQEAFCMKVTKIYLNWHNAPLDYLLDRLSILREMCKGTDAAPKLEQRLNELREQHATQT